MWWINLFPWRCRIPWNDTAENINSLGSTCGYGKSHHLFFYNVVVDPSINQSMHCILFQSRVLFSVKLNLVVIFLLFCWIMAECPPSFMRKCSRGGTIRGWTAASMGYVLPNFSSTSVDFECVILSLILSFTTKFFTDNSLIPFVNAHMLYFFIFYSSTLSEKRSIFHIIVYHCSHIN